MGLYSPILWLFLLAVKPLSTWAQTEPVDTTVTQLEEVIVTAPVSSLSINSRVTRISAEAVRRKTHSVGEADFVATLKTLTGVSSTSDYSSGFSVEGASASQNMHYINSAPIIFPYRFGGIFSTFNTYHFSSATFKRYPDVSETPHLGGSVNFIPRRPSNGLEGAVNIGMTAASASIAVLNPKGAFVRVSGRVSFLNQLYGFILKSKNNSIAYSFSDLNLTAGAYVAGGNLQLNVFYNSDNLNYSDHNYANSTKMDWANTLISLHHIATRNLTFVSDIYYSGFSNTLNLDASQSFLKVPSSLKTVGAHFTVYDSDSDAPLLWKCTANTELYCACPQRANLMVSTENQGEFADLSSPLRRETLFSLGAGCEALWNTIPDILNITATITAGFARSNIEGSFYSIPYFSPSLRVQWKKDSNKVETEVAMRSQYLHRVGFSELGLASDFWIVANERAPLERSISSSVSWESELLPLNLRSQVRIYHSWIYNQPEYRGLVLEIAQSDYDPISHLIIANGTNTGIGLSLSREIGQITGAISYSFGTGRRHLQNKRGSWRAINSEGHSFKAQAVWERGSHWVFALSLNLSSGRVFTPVNSIYIIGGNIAMDYGKRNSKRLPAYFNLNLSATYQFKTGIKKSLSHYINLSIQNVTGHKNTEMQYFILNSEDGSYGLKRIYSMYNFLPSISYSIEF